MNTFKNVQKKPHTENRSIGGFYANLSIFLNNQWRRQALLLKPNWLAVEKYQPHAETDYAAAEAGHNGSGERLHHQR